MEERADHFIGNHLVDQMEDLHHQNQFERQLAEDAH